MALSKSTSSKATKVVKPRHHKKRTTVSDRQFQFRSFAERVSALSIDPIRKRRTKEDQDELEDARVSYFSRSLARWRESNLSKTFTAFARQVAPLADNLPIVLHNQDQIIALLTDAISTKDELALEPLTGLLADFARDLNTQFEKHFASAVSTVAEAAATSTNAAVIEWCFTCLAWLFKYLSRLLVPDLVPVFELMAPYLGRKPQRPHIVRFAAESMSFLLRKSSLSKENPESLPRLLDHMLETCQLSEDDEATDLYQQGVMTLLTEAIKGVQHNMNSAGLRIVTELLKQSRKHSSQASSAVLRGCLTSLMHFSTPNTFQEVFSIVLADCEQQDMTAVEQTTITAELTFVLVAVRKGSRIQDWPQLLKLVDRLETARRALQLPRELAARIMSLLSLTLCTCPSVLDLHKMATLQSLDRFQPEDLLHICDLVARINRERFQTMLLPKLRKLLRSPVGTLLHSEVKLSTLTDLFSESEDSDISIPEAAIDGLLSPLENAAWHEPEQMSKAYTALRFMSCIRLSGNIATPVHTTLTSLLLTPSDTLPSKAQQILFGHALELWLHTSDSPPEAAQLFTSLARRAESLPRTALIWRNILNLLQMLSSSSDIQSINLAVLQAEVIKNLTLSSHDLRELNLKILKELYIKAGNNIPSILDLALSIERTPVNLENARTLSMNVRRLGADFHSYIGDNLLMSAIPSFCMGLLHIRLSQLWADATAALAQMAQNVKAEEVIMSIAKDWLEGASPTSGQAPAVEPLLTDATPMTHVSSEFECPNLIKMSAISDQVFSSLRSGRPTAHEALLSEVDLDQLSTSEDRSQALRVLDGMAEVAEKRSRLLVPVLLSWTGDSSEDTQITGQRWTRKDQKAMLSIFAKFHNPRVLYRSQEVQPALLKLCANGDVEIQRAALIALLAWKSPGLVRYREHLINVLDDAHFREELTVFLQGDDEDSLRDADVEDVMPVLLRLIYGRLVGGSKESQQSRRKAAFVALARYNDNALQMMIDIVTQDLTDVESTLQQCSQDQTSKLKLPIRQQLGMLNMLGDMVEVIGSRLLPFSENLLETIAVCSVLANRRLQQDDLADLEDTSLLRAVRQQGMQCLVKLYTCMPDVDQPALASLVRTELLQSRLENFVAENGQSISSTLRLLATWSDNAKLHQMLWHEDHDMTTAIAQLLQASITKNDVRLFVLDQIMSPLISHSPSAVSNKGVASFTSAITALLGQKPEKAILASCIKVVSKLATLIDDADQARNLLDICGALLVQPTQVVAARTKVDLLKTTMPLVKIERLGFQEKLFSAMCGLFSRLRGTEHRSILAESFAAVCASESSLDEVAALCDHLNAVSNSRLDEADHDKQEQAFVKIYEQSSHFTALQWKPLMHNFVYLLHDEEDLVNRSSAVKALKLMIAAGKPDLSVAALVQDELFYAIQRGMSHKSEFVRAECVNLLECLVSTYSDWQEVKDLAVLLETNDEQTSVLGDILHIQQHRRLQALRRLGAAPSLASANIDRFILPLLEHFVFDPAPGDSGRTLADQTVQTIGLLATRMRWVHLRKTLARYYAQLKSANENDKVILRLIGVLIDGLVQVLQRSGPNGSAGAEDTQREDETDDLAISAISSNRTKIVSRDLLPPLLAFLHHKDESEVDRRVGIAVSVVKLLKLLPEDEFAIKLAPVLTDVSHILRSRDLEARDQSRRALSSILRLIGLQYFGFLLKEMRGALQRGYQLHVLSFSVHHLLVTVADSMQIGELDECTDELCAIIMDDIFGTTGIEKDTEEYRSNMKEIKASKSYDTMEILARSLSVSRLGGLLLPLRAMLGEALDTTMVRKIDNLLLRIQQGIDQNPEAKSRAALSLYHELLRYRTSNDDELDNLRKDLGRKYVKKASAPRKQNATSYQYKISAFALASLRKTLRRHEDLRTAQNISGFIDLVANLLVEGQEECRYEAARLLSTIVHLHLPALDAGAALYLKEAIAMVKDSRSTATDGARAGLELSTAILREKRDAQIRETDVALLLRHIKADMDQPDRQGQMFRFLRAVLGRKIVVTEVYEVMDELAKSMVNNPDENVRQNARAAYVQFLIDFPQTKDRWTKTTAFLIKNFGFEHASGRRSTLEVVHLLLGRLNGDVVQELAPSLYVGLVPMLISDQDSACRSMAAALVAQLVGKLDATQLSKIKTMTMKWLRNGSKGGITIAAMQCWTIMVKEQKSSKKDVDDLLTTLQDALASSDLSSSASKQSSNALDLFLAICEHYPDQAFSNKMKKLWASLGAVIPQATQEIRQRLLAAYRLLFDDVARATFSNKARTSKVTSTSGLELDPAFLRQICLIHISCLRGMSEHDESSAEDLTRNLLFLGRVFVALQLDWIHTKAPDEDDSDEEAEEESIQVRGSAVSYLFSRLAYLVRRENAPVAARIIALQTAGGLLSLAASSIDNIDLLVRPLYVLTDASVAHRENEEFQILIDRAREVLAVLEKQVGSDKYVAMLAEARRGVIERRDERRQKRKIEAVSLPERWEKEKRKKHDAKKMKSKAKTEVNRAKRAFY